MLPPPSWLRLALAVSFTPCCQGQKRFRLALRVRRKPEPLVVTVKASCLPMAATLQVEMPDRVVRKISPEQEHTLDFGEVGSRLLGACGGRCWG